MANPNPVRKPLTPEARAKGQWKRGQNGAAPKDWYDVKALAKEHTEAAVKALVDVLRRPKATDAAKVAAATVLLDRGWGKATQHVEFDAKRDIANFIASLATGTAPADSEPVEERPGDVRH